MSKFLNTIGPYLKQFREDLPRLLGKTAIKYEGTYLLQRDDGVEITSFLLKDDKIAVYKMSSNPKGCCPGAGRLSYKLDYKTFVRKLSRQELISVAEKLKELGF